MMDIFSISIACNARKAHLHFLVADKSVYIFLTIEFVKKDFMMYIYSCFHQDINTVRGKKNYPFVHFKTTLK